MSLEAPIETNNTAPVVDSTPAVETVAPPAAKPVDAGSIFDGLDDTPVAAVTEGAAEKPAVEPRWPDNWKELAAGGDDKLSKIVGRYQSPAGMAKALAHAQDLIRSGELKRTLPTDAKPEDVAKWRKENGLPEKPEGYEIPKVSGIDIAADDPALASFREIAHGANLSPEQFSKAVEWYGESLRAAQEQRYEADKTAKAATEDELRAEFGGEYRSTMTLTGRFLDAEFGELKGEVLNARLSDGRRLGNVPEIIKHFAKMAAEADGGIGLIRGDATSAKDIESRLAELQSMASSPDPDKSAQYWSEKIQTEERELLLRREKLNGR